MADIKLSYGSVKNFDNMPDDNFIQGRLLFANDNTQSYLYFDNGSQYLNIVPRLLSVKNGGTGHTKLNPGEVLIGNDENAILFRAITDNSTLSYVKDNSISALKETLMQTCSLSNKEREMMGAKARRFILENKNPKNQCEKIVAMVESKS